MNAQAGLDHSNAAFPGRGQYIADHPCLMQGPPKAINMGGTRFTPVAASGVETPSSTNDSPSISIIGSDAPGQDYSILATPSFTPGIEESPFITWGAIQGTPLRLDLEDDIEVDPAGASGPQFEIREVCYPCKATWFISMHGSSDTGVADLCPQDHKHLPYGCVASICFIRFVHSCTPSQFCSARCLRVGMLVPHVLRQVLGMKNVALSDTASGRASCCVSACLRSSLLMCYACMQRSGKDALAQRLGRRAATKLRERTATARRKTPLPMPGSMPPPGTTPGRRGRPGTLTPARPQMSQAGKKLAETLHGK